MVEDHITVVSGCDKLVDFLDAIKGKTIVTFDVEGVNLSRIGRPTLCSVGINSSDHVNVFVFDISDETAEHQKMQIRILRDFLESTTITKIIHDCRQDSDSLNEFFGIRIVNVFDTSVYNMEIKGSSQRDNLNNTLASYDCPINPDRHNKAFYKKRPNYWLERPLTAEQITSAAQDVTSLFLLRERILHHMNNVRNYRQNEIRKASEEAISEFREKRFVHYMAMPESKLWFNIGTSRIRLRDIETQSNTAVSARTKAGFLILAHTLADLDNVINIMTDVAGRKKGKKTYKRNISPLVLDVVDTPIHAGAGAGAGVTKNKNSFSLYFSIGNIYKKTLSKLKKFITRPDVIRNLIYYSLVPLLLLFLYFMKGDPDNVPVRRSRVR